MNKKWGNLVPVREGVREKGRRGTRGFGGSLKTDSKSNRATSKSLGQVSFAFMAFYVGGLWAGVLIDAPAVLNSVGKIAFVGLFFAAVSHMLLLLCDSLSCGRAKEALWAVWVFWGGVLLAPLVAGLGALF